MLVVEGPDGAGKTVLIGKILQSFPKLSMPAVIDRSQLPNVNVRERVYEAIAEEVRGWKPPQVHDRLFYSELVYGPILRGSCKFAQPEKRWIATQLLMTETVVIICLPPLSVVKLNILSAINEDPKAHIPGVQEKMDDIYRSYERLAGAALTTNLSRGLEAVTHDYKRDSHESLFPLIERHIERRKVRETGHVYRNQ